MNKKGISSGFLVSALIAVTVVIVLFVLLIKLLPIFSSGLTAETCRQSVVMKTQTTGVFSESPVIPNIECYTRYVEFRKDGVYKKNKVDEKYEKVDSYGKDREDKIKEWFARELADCWYQFNEGNALPFGQDTLVTKSVHCVQCSELKFDEDIRKEMANSITEFSKWMEENDVSDYQKSIISESGTSYKNYLDRNQAITYYKANVGPVPVPFTAGDIDVKSLVTEDKFNTNEKYYILLVANVPGYVSSPGMGHATFLSNLDRFATAMLMSESELTKGLANGRVDCQRMY